MNPRLSIIVPCFNSEDTLEETLDSVGNLNFQEWECIIIDDGSTDNTAAIAKKYTEKDIRIKYFFKENGGLGTARNYGIRMSKGGYILPLDSDNKVRSHFPKKAINFLENSRDYDIVYGNAKYFGERQGIWKMGDFDKFKLLSFNYIDACAIIRKEVFEDVGSYEEKLPYQGHEDWEFWIRAFKGGKKFFYLDEVTFDYRVLNNSMIRSFTDEKDLANEKYIKTKHASLYIDNFKPLYWRMERYKSEGKQNILSKFKRRLKKLFKS